jgi:hypothetical protein
MRALSAGELLEVWERGLALSPAQRALILLAAGLRDLPLEEVAKFTIGERDGRLLALRQDVFGPELRSLTNCPACNERLEFQIAISDLLGVTPPRDGDRLQVQAAEHAIEFRLPTSLDVASLDPAVDEVANREQLLRRCVLTARRGETEIAPADLPEEAVIALTERMAAADPQADLQLSLACPGCQHTWQTPLDIVSYFWSEIQAWANGILREIHALASAYGWNEDEVLALSPWRRHAYLELIES